MKNNPWIKKEETVLPDGRVWVGPFPRQQTFLLHTHRREVFYGGAGGGGKSQALWYAALQYVDTPGYAALILRRTYADLALAGAIMDRSQEYLAGTGATWRDKDKKWVFPSGATVTFGYLENETDKHRYASAEFQYIAFDELTHFTESQYRFLFTRLRRLASSKVPLRMRSASNPGSRGHDWVKGRFVDPKTRAKGTVFVPARMRDNFALDVGAYEESLGNADPLTRAQIKEGDWDAVVSGRCKREWLHTYRCLSLPVGTTYTTTKPFDVGSFHKRFLTVDTAATVKETAKDDPDYTVISAWGVSPQGELLWLGCWRGRVESPDIPPEVARMYVLHKAGAVYVESGGTQKSVPQYLRRHDLRPGVRMNVIEWQPGGRDKLANAGHFLTAAEAGRVWLPDPRDVPHFPLEEARSELLRFTGDDKRDGHDDIVTTASIAGWVLSADAALQGGKKAAPFAGGTRQQAQRGASNWR